MEQPSTYRAETFPSAPDEVLYVQPLHISEDEARKSFLELAKKRFGSSSALVKDMTIQKMGAFNTYRYSLETFTETRMWGWKDLPYYGGDLDGPSNGPAPYAWEVKVNSPDWFVAEKKLLPVPHTSEVKLCSHCGGVGRTRCLDCIGTGMGRCLLCHGFGRNVLGRCVSCAGMGYARCPGCGGFGYRRCLTCSGTGKLHQFLQLTVQWENHNFEFIADNKSDFPTECFKNVTGLKMFYDEQKMVSPVTHFHEPSINKASKNGISQHRAELTESKILRQRHSIEWLPLTKVNYIWKDGEYDYYVYGNENQTFAKNFPKKEHFAIM